MKYVQCAHALVLHKKGKVNNNDIQINVFPRFLQFSIFVNKVETVQDMTQTRGSLFKLIVTNQN